MIFLFHHGLFLDKNFFKFIKKELKGETIDLNAGYYGKKEYPKLPKGKKIIAIGSDIGFAKLIKNYPDCNYYIPINAMLNYSQITGIEVMVESLLTSLNNAPTLTTTAFINREGIDSYKFNTKEFNKKILEKDLREIPQINLTQEVKNKNIFVIFSKYSTLIDPDSLKEQFKLFEIMEINNINKKNIIVNESEYLTSIIHLIEQRINN